MPTISYHHRSKFSTRRDVNEYISASNGLQVSIYLGHLETRRRANQELEHHFSSIPKVSCASDKCNIRVSEILSMTTGNTQRHRGFRYRSSRSDWKFQLGQLKKEMIRDHLVVELKGVQLSERLHLNPNLTLDVAEFATFCHKDRICSPSTDNQLVVVDY